MPDNLISVDEYLAKRTLSVRKEDGVVFRAAKPSKSFNPETRSCRFLMTDESVDSYGDEVKAKGAKFERFNENPIALLNHRSSDPIGTWSDIEQKPKSILGTMTLGAEGTSEEIDKTYRLMEQKILRGASIGFMPLEIEMKRDKDGNALWEFIIHTWELYECSVVSIPANANALAKAMKEGDTLCRDTIEEVLDTWVKTASGLIVSREDFEKAHKEGSGNKTAVGISIKMDDEGKLKAIIEKAFDEAIAKGHITVEPEIVPDPIIVELEKSMDSFEKQVEELPEGEKERKNLLSRIIDGTRSLFKTATEPEKTEEPPALATEAEKAALQRRLLEMRIEDLAA